MREKGRERLALGAAILLTAVLALLSVRVGSYPLSTGQILDILSGGLAGTTPAHVLWNLRLPRVGMGLLAGWALGMAGGVYQTVFRNPLASPDLTGVASGASFGAAWAIVLGAGTSLQIMGGAFIMGSLSLLLVLALVRVGRDGTHRGLYPGGGHRLLGGGRGPDGAQDHRRPGGGTGRHRVLDHGQPVRHDRETSSGGLRLPS